MRIGILGKGGSGKTSITTTLAIYFAKQQFTLVIDADQNANIARALESNPPLSLADHEEEIFAYLHQHREGITPIGTTPPGKNSTFIRVQENDPFLKKYASINNNHALLQVGTYTSDDVGVSCYHGKQAGLEAVFHHLLDTEEDIVLTDSTAGLDSLGNSLYLVHDIIFYVVEPTEKSVSVYKQFKDIAQEKNIHHKVIANKIYDEQDMTYLLEHIDEQDILVTFSFDPTLRRVEQGDANARETFLKKHEQQCKQIEEYVRSLSKDWKTYHQTLIETHKKSAQEWYDEYYNEKLSEQIDTEFRYEDVL